MVTYGILLICCYSSSDRQRARALRGRLDTAVAATLAAAAVALHGGNAAAIAAWRRRLGEVCSELTMAISIFIFVFSLRHHLKSPLRPKRKF